MKLHMLLMWLNFLQVAWFTPKECKKTKKERRLRSLVKKQSLQYVKRRHPVQHYVDALPLVV